ncbi:HAD-IB family hydrolase [Corynebacterium amycolatum]|uniref:HAD-IB family hydrolase n=2 Tax=Corynebacterium TaxID=1716 RepID=A0AB37GF04_CORAY|nr:HAD-IB family hydrolase [Corynebacterium amycolatum]QPR31644.1 HAD-IB family hydrolase [Corynebacterium amycolatum]QQB83523.1 HAD-IB family hydrolase [Corynebacterium amycolatum]QQU99080.1 HAD-IB family hydrolase [Corynebacterium amycolatum]
MSVAYTVERGFRAVSEFSADNRSPFPIDMLGDLASSQGNVRNFLEQVVLAPLNDEAQEEAGAAAAANALEALGEVYDVGGEELATGFRSVAGAEDAAGGARVLSQPIPGVERDQGAAAFFDVDNTLVQGASIFLFAMGLVERGFIKKRDLAGMIWKQLKFRISGAENAADVAKAREQALEFFAGHDVDEMVKLGEEIFEEKISDRVYQGTRDLAELHIQAGQEVWLVTATPVQLAQVIAKHIGLTGALGTVAEVKDGKFTGRLVGDILHGPGKKHAVAALAASSGLDMSRCTAYSDSANDIPMLSMVGTAVAINPDRKLRNYAQKMGWTVYDYRHFRSATFATMRWLSIGALLAGAVGGAGLVGKRLWDANKES